MKEHSNPGAIGDMCSSAARRSMLNVECFPVSQNWLLLQSGKSDAAFNMALDEALLEAMPRLSIPVLRFYGWTEPAATFGYFQKYAEVVTATKLRPLIRRPTGGGIVPHAADWTYSAVFPVGHEWHSLKAGESYRRIHDWLRLAFAGLRVETELAPCCKKSLPGQCFVGHEKYDLLWRGKKIAGAAQRRNKLGLLIQGSVQPPPVLSGPVEFAAAMRGVAEKQFFVQWQDYKADRILIGAADILVRQKFSQAAHNQKR